MKSLIVTCAAELKDRRCLDIIYRHSEIDVFRNIHGAISESWLVDRTLTTKLPFQTTVLAKHFLPTIKTPPLSLLETCLFRASELIDQSKKIYFLWSGGINSTTALISFLMLGVVREQLIIVCNNESINENAKFYKDHILGKFNLLASELLIQQLKFSKIDGIILSCDQANLLCGQNFGYTMVDYYGNDILYEPASRENVVKFFIDNNLNIDSANCWYDVFMSSIDKSIRPIDNMYDFAWWVGFNWEWQWSAEKLKLKTSYENNIQTFYDSNEMQAWSIYHTQPNIATKSDFKCEFNKILFEYTKDSSYFSKIKHPSTTLNYMSDSYVAIDSENKRYKSKEFSIVDYYCSDNFISQWLTD